ncbi:MAG: hypothetical protein JWM34_64 [Ilumatobacteraceae bacterium]|nr:hypothetical protein [Ilumatobacteraceae bacterium]
MSLDSDRYLRAIDGFGRVVRATAATDWDAQSPCSEWTARDVVGHVVAVQHAIIATIAGERAPMNPMVDPGRHAGDDPAAACADASAAVTSAIAAPGVLDRIVKTWRGEVTVDDMLGYNVGDTIIHTWDLARAVGADDRLDPDLVEVALARLLPVADAMRGPSMFGDLVAVPADADPQTRLLALVGRTP